MAIITLEEVKVLAQITDNSKDAVIDLMIPEVEGFIKSYTKNDFSKGYPVGIKRVVAQMIRFDVYNRNKGLGVSSQSISTHSINFDADYIAGYPAKLIGSLNAFSKNKQVQFV